MKRDRCYREGSVDVKNKAIFDERGVDVIDYPYIRYAAEKIGGAATLALMSCSIFRSPALLESEGARRYEPLPRTKRIIGAGLMTMGIACGIVAQTEDLLSLAPQLSDVSNFVEVMNPLMHDEGI